MGIEKAEVPVITSIGRNRSTILTAQKMQRDYELDRIAVIGCGTGEQVYTLTYILDQRISGYDISEPAILSAQTGVISIEVPDDQSYAYTRDIVKKISQESKVVSESQIEVNDKLKKLAAFTVHNILQASLPSRFDLILCTNVLTYFKLLSYQKSPTDLEDALNNISQSLHPKGILITEGFDHYFFRSQAPHHYLAKYMDYMKHNPYFRFTPELGVPVTNEDMIPECANVFVKNDPTDFS